MIVLALMAALLTAPAGAGEEVPTCLGEPATIVGTDGDDELAGTPDRDVVWAGPGADTVRAGAGDDVVCGGPGSDELRGGAGDDVVADLITGSPRQALLGGPGDNALHLSWRVVRDGEEVGVHLEVQLRSGFVRVDEHGPEFPLGSFRRVTGGFAEGTWSVWGTAADEELTTHQYVAVDVRAGAGRDVVRGSWHDDVIRGGPGRDTAYPDRGRDSCKGVEALPQDRCEQEH